MRPQHGAADAELAQALSPHRSGNAAAALPLYRRVIARERQRSQTCGRNYM